MDTVVIYWKETSTPTRIENVWSIFVGSGELRLTVDTGSAEGLKDQFHILWKIDSYEVFRSNS